MQDINTLDLLIVIIALLITTVSILWAAYYIWISKKRAEREKVQLQRSQRYRNELFILSDIVRAISVDFDLDNLLDKILEFAVQVINQAQKGAILTKDEIKGDRLIVRGTYNFPKDVRGNEHLIGEGYSGWVAKERKPLLIHDVQQDYTEGKFVSRFTPLKMEMNIRSSIAAPIMSQDTDYGVIILHSTEKTHAFNEDDQRLLTVIADQVAIAIENNYLYKETEAALVEHQALYQIGLLLTNTDDVAKVLNLIVESALKITGTPAGSLALYDPQKRDFYLASSIGFSPAFSNLPRWKMREGGLTAKILSMKDPLVVSEIKEENTDHGVNAMITKEGIKSLVAVPLKLENQVIGILYVDDFVPREFTKRELSALTLLANQAAIALMKAQAFREQMERAITDGLTKLYNHRYFQESLERDIRRAERYKHPVSMIMSDIDRFKNYNDLFGHPRGDKALTTVADILRRMVRETDMIARYGGEEFAIILPETSKQDALRVARKICMTVEADEIFGEETLPGGKFTISCGVATFPDDALTKQGLIDQADRALYKAKNSGRNVVIGARKLDKTVKKRLVS